MQVALNSKFFDNLSVERLGEKAVELGYDGIDVNVRPGHPVNPGNALVALPRAVRHWQKQGLACPLATAPVSFTDPGSPNAEPLYAACAEAGIPRLKIGFWGFIPGGDYWSAVDAARTALEGFARHSQRFGVQTCYQVHSGPNLGSNCAGLAHLIRGFDARHVGAYPDTGHLALDGEDWDMGFAMVQEHLSVVGIKDARHVPQPLGQVPRYTPRFVKLGEGSIDWRRCLAALRRVGFDGPLSVHTEYEFDESIIRRVGYNDTAPPNLEEWAKADAAFLRNELT
jgi:sugar phosphate isomerase/epimerase